MTKSPYKGLSVNKWINKTKGLIDNHPLTDCIVEMCLRTWESILNGKINTHLNLLIKDMSISPQAMGALLHDVISEYIIRRTKEFRKGESTEKDLVCVKDEFFSVEIKTSSQKDIYGNRSYAKSKGGKDKSGYYLAINFDKLCKDNPNPKINLIRFGWLDYSDWKGQKSETGQQASLSKNALRYKLMQLYP